MKTDIVEKMRKNRALLLNIFLVILGSQNIFSQVTTQTFNCSGAPQVFTVPPCVTSMTVQAWGAGGGGGGIDTYTGSPGGGGAYASSVLAVVPGQALTVIVGCGGSQGGACQGNGPGGVGGYGLGTGGNGGNSGPNGCSGPGGGGGGGTGIMNGGTILIVAGGGGGGGGGGNFGDGADGGGGGQSGFAQSSAGGILGASGTTNGLPGATTANDGAGGGGGGGGLNGGGGGQVPGTDYGGSGGSGGTSLGTTIMNGNHQVPGNSGSPNLCAGCAAGGNGGTASPGNPGELVISYNLPPPITGTITSTSSCGLASATVTASGGTPGYTYTWSPTGGNGTVANNLTNGSYTVDIKDANGCMGTANANIVLPPALTLTAVHNNVTCNGLANGTATATATGGTGPYTYGWAPGPPQISTTGIASGLSGGTTYTVGVQDAMGCQDTLSVVITQPSVLTQTLTATSPICAGSSSVLNDAVSGGTAPYTITWSSGGSSVGALVTTTVSPAVTTTYSASVLDANNCANTVTVSVVVNPVPVVTANASSVNVCAGTPVTLTGGGATSYVWSGGVTDGVAFTPGATATYTVTGTSAGCSATATITVNVNPTPTITVNSPAFCAGNSAVLTAGGANTYVWSPAGGLSATSGTTVTASPATTTIYTITGTDINSCTATATSTVTVNALPAVTATSGTICSGSSVTITAGGANTYTWSPATGLSSVNGSNVTAGPSSTTSYTVTGTDINNCVNTATTSVVVNPLPVINVNSPAICTGGTATLTANGASTYTWSPATGLSSVNGASVTSSPAATTAYTITGTDANGCVNTGTSTVTVNNPPLVSVNSATICAGSSTILTAGGAISYTWSPATGLSSSNGSSVTANPAATTIYTVTGSNGCIGTATSTVVVNNLPVVTVNSATLCAGNSATLTATGATTYSWTPATGLNATNTNSVIANPASTTVYTVSGTDANACTSTASSTVIVNPIPAAVAGSNSPVCVNQTINLTGSGPISAWAGPNGFISAQQNPSIANATIAMSGTYTLVVTSASNCTNTASVNVTVNPLPIVVAGNNGPVCVNQTLNFNGNGGTIYNWVGPIGFNSPLQNPTIASANVSQSGTYTLVVQDANGCISSATTSVTVNPLPVVTVNSAVICVGNSASLTANGALNYNWNPGTGLSSTNGSNVTASPVSTTVYTITGTSATTCSSTATSTVTVNPLPVVTVNSATICSGSNTVLTAGGANTYNWNPSAGLSSSTTANPVASPNVTSSYTVFGTSIAGCVNTATCTVTVNALPVVSVNPPISSGCAPVCVNFSNNGTTSANASYSWNFGNGTTATGQAVQSCYANAGTYTATLLVTDSNGCKNTGTSVVSVFPIPKANFAFSPQNTTIFDPNIQFYDLSTGAVINDWHWYFGDGDSSQIQNPLHTYADTGLYYPHLTVFSDHGCWNIIWEVIYISPEFLIYVPNAFTPNFDGDNDVFMPKGEGIVEYTLRIYDRWGMELFKSNDLNVGWDGKKGGEVLMQDVYVWSIELKNIKGEPKHLSGVVSLIK